MAQKKLNSERLARHLARYGFRLNAPEAKKGGISFVRASSIKRLYDHVLISAENPVYAETAISGASCTSCHACVSERDSRLRALLAGDSPFQTSRIGSSAEARAWEMLLIEQADVFSALTAAEKGPPLALRLQPVVTAVDEYVARLDDVFAILDREFGFLNEAPSDELFQIERLAALSRSMLYLNLDDARLASLAVVRFGPEVEGQDRPFIDAVPHRDAGLAARLVLLADFIGRKRDEYAAAGGLNRIAST